MVLIEYDEEFDIEEEEETISIVLGSRYTLAHHKCLCDHA
jgi:hypothetical protein